MLPDFTLDSLYELFPNSPDQPIVDPISGELVPEPYRKLLVHNHHMTVTLEEFYGRPVDVSVLDSRTEGETYARKILLNLRPGGEVIQFGLVEIDLAKLSPTVRDQIVEQKTPLGRVLIQNDVLRTVHPIQFFRVTPTKTMCDWFGLDKPQVTYGRLGVITTDGEPAIRVAEILTPVEGVRIHS